MEKPILRSKSPAPLPPSNTIIHDEVNNRMDSGETSWGSMSYFTIQTQGNEKQLKEALVTQIVEAYKSNKKPKKATPQAVARPMLSCYRQNSSFYFGFSPISVEKLRPELEKLNKLGFQTTIGNYDDGIALTLSSEYSESLVNHIRIWCNKFDLTINSIEALHLLIHRNVGGRELTDEEEKIFVRIKKKDDRQTLSNAGANLHQLLARFPNGEEIEFKVFERPTQRGNEVRRIATMYFRDCRAVVKVQALPDKIENIIYNAPIKQMPSNI